MSDAPWWPAEAAALLIVECDGTPRRCRGRDRARRGRRAPTPARSRSGGPRRKRSGTRSGHVRRQVSLALRATGLLKINHDVVVPRGRVPELFDVIADLKRRHTLRVASFGHAGDGNIHVNLMVNRDDQAERARAAEAERELFERVVALEGSISGEHGIGFAKAHYLPIELSPEAIALMKRVKAAFDPNGILNPGKIFPCPRVPRVSTIRHERDHLDLLRRIRVEHGAKANVGGVQISSFAQLLQRHTGRGLDRQQIGRTNDEQHTLRRLQEVGCLLGIEQLHPRQARVEAKIPREHLEDTDRLAGLTVGANQCGQLLDRLRADAGKRAVLDRPRA